MKVSLIITTYNWPDALHICLKSVLLQKQMPDEVIIADDGSGKETADLIQSFQSKFSVPLIHAWQKDNGFRAAASRNNAIRKATGDYIVIADGDLILNEYFIKDHYDQAKQNQFIQATRALIKAEDALERLKNKNAEGFGFFSKAILKNRKNTIRNPFLSHLFSKITTSIHQVRSANMSFFKDDLYKINGFNEDFVGWGREDTELVVRLINAGIERKNLKFSALVYHLYHEEKSRESLPKNDAILQESIDEKLSWCENGLINKTNI